MKRLMFRSTLTAIVLFAMSLGSHNAHADFINVTNTSTELSGSFDANGFGTTLRVRDTPFSGLLPGDITTQILQTTVLPEATDLGRAFFFDRGAGEGIPDDPFVRCDTNLACAPVFGSYSNNIPGQLVDFSITNLSFDGTRFSGDFSFTVSEVPVPAAAWLFGSGLIGLIGIARRKYAA